MTQAESSATHERSANPGAFLDFIQQHDGNLDLLYSAWPNLVRDFTTQPQSSDSEQASPQEETAPGSLLTRTRLEGNFAVRREEGAAPVLLFETREGNRSFELQELPDKLASGIEKLSPAMFEVGLSRSVLADDSAFYHLEAVYGIQGYTDPEAVPADDAILLYKGIVDSMYPETSVIALTGTSALVDHHRPMVIQPEEHHWLRIDSSSFPLEFRSPHITRPVHYENQYGRRTIAEPTQGDEVLIRAVVVDQGNREGGQTALESEAISLLAPSVRRSTLEEQIVTEISELVNSIDATDWRLATAAVAKAVLNLAHKPMWDAEATVHVDTRLRGRLFNILRQATNFGFDNEPIVLKALEHGQSFLAAVKEEPALSTMTFDQFKDYMVHNLSYGALHQSNFTQIELARRICDNHETGDIALRSWFVVRSQLIDDDLFTARIGNIIDMVKRKDSDKIAEFFEELVQDERVRPEALYAMLAERPIHGYKPSSIDKSNVKTYLSYLRALSILDERVRRNPDDSINPGVRAASATAKQAFQRSALNFMQVSEQMDLIKT